MKLNGVILILQFLLVSCISNNKKYNDGYPDAWWQPLPKAEIASWEIPPQAADRSKGEVILSKRGELGVFSNFQEAPFILDGKQYASIEGLWQSMKYPENKSDERLKNKEIKWPYTRDQVSKMVGFEAKKAGDLAGEIMKKLDIKWISYRGKKIDYTGKDQLAHYEIILRASRAKLKANPSFAELLLKTNNLKLLPDHTQKTNAPLAYRYYDIYMKLRDELKLKSKQ